MNTELNDDDDVTQYLPILRRETPMKDSTVEEFEAETGMFPNREMSWFETFANDVKDDIDPNKLHELIVDHLICSGYRDVARLLCEDANMKFPPALVDNADTSTLCNVETLDRRDAIRDAIVAGNIEIAITLINELAPDLMKTNERLRFNLLRQQIVELIRKRDIDKVLSFAQDNIMDKCQQPPEQFTRLEQTFALLAFDRPEESPFGYLMSIKQRNMLAYDVNEAILAHLKLNPTSKLENLMRIIVFNHHQAMNKGEPLSPDAQFGREKAYRVSRELFGSSSDESYDAAL